MAWHALIKLHMKPLLTIRKIQYTKAVPERIVFIKRGITVLLLKQLFLVVPNFLLNRLTDTLLVHVLYCYIYHILL